MGEKEGGREREGGHRVAGTARRRVSVPLLLAGALINSAPVVTLLPTSWPAKRGDHQQATTRGSELRFWRAAAAGAAGQSWV